MRISASVDDIGLLPVETDAAKGLYWLADAAHEKRSIAVLSNGHTAGFDERMPKTPAIATVSWLLHHAHVWQTRGDSIRFTEALPKGGHPDEPTARNYPIADATTRWEENNGNRKEKVHCSTAERSDSPLQPHKRRPPPCALAKVSPRKRSASIRAPTVQPSI